METNKFHEILPQILAHNRLIWEWVRGHKKCLKVRQKWRNDKNRYLLQHCFSFTTKLDDNSTTHAKLQALYLPFVLKNGTESHHRRQERETGFEVFDKVSEPSFQVVWPCNVVLSTFKDSKGAYAIHQPSTDSLKVYRRSPGIGTSC